MVFNIHAFTADRRPCAIPNPQTAGIYATLLPRSLASLGTTHWHFLTPSNSPSANCGSSIGIEEPSQESKKVLRHLDRIQDLKRYEDNWNGYGSEKPNTFSRAIAEGILLESVPYKIPDNVSPSAQGGINLVFYAGNRYADIECFNSGEILGTTAIGNEDPDIWIINPSEIKNALEKIGQFLAA